VGLKVIVYEDDPQSLRSHLDESLQVSGKVTDQNHFNPFTANPVKALHFAILV